MKLVLMTFLALIPASLFAQPTNEQRPALPPAPVTATMATVSSSDTIRGIDISSSPATSVVISTSAQYRQVCVQNFDTTNYLACSENANVSSSVASNLIGTIIPAAPTAATPATPLCFSIKAGTDFYCKNSGSTGTTRAGITRGR